MSATTSFAKRLTLTVLLPALLAGCATRSPYEDASDPLEPVNRAIYTFNDKLDRAVIKPVAQAATINEVARIIGEDCDIILAEGFKEADAPKIEVHRREVGPPLDAVRKLFAIATVSV